MSYLDVRFDPVIAAATGATNRQTPDGDERLGTREWEIVEIARIDGPRGSDANGLGVLLFRKLFGVETERSLSDPRLEALRRFAAKGWYRDCIRARDLRDLFKAGFSSNDAWRVLAHIAERRGRMPDIDVWPA